MRIKCLLLNIPHNLPNEITSDIEITNSTLSKNSTLHDFHALIIDTDTLFNLAFWGNYGGDPSATDFYKSDLLELSKKVKEQIETGGVTFIFCGAKYQKKLLIKGDSGNNQYSHLDNYFLSPIEIGGVNETGDTFYPKYEDLKYFSTLIKSFQKEDITWTTYFSKLPEKTKILGTNRAGYPIFAEIQIGNGKLVLLPRFKDMKKAVSIIVNNVIPQLIHEELGTFTPIWLENYFSDFEKKTRTALGNIEKTKRLLYTKDKALKKAVAFAFETLGFAVKVLPDGTNADLEISDNEQNAICEVKGHENRQTNRDELLQLLGYSTPDGKDIKSIFISNHEFSKNPQERSKDAFTQGAIILGVNNKLSLISALSLYGIVTEILQGNISEKSKADLRKKILNGQGIVQLT